MQKVRIIKRFDQVYAIRAAQFLLNRLPNGRVLVNGKQDTNVLMFLDELAQYPHAVTHHVAKAFAPVRCHDNYMALREVLE